MDDLLDSGVPVVDDRDSEKGRHFTLTFIQLKILERLKVGIR